jgi:hypothetical protein
MHSRLNKMYIKLIHRKESGYEILNTGYGTENGEFMLHDPLNIGVLK